MNPVSSFYERRMQGEEVPFRLGVFHDGYYGWRNEKGATMPVMVRNGAMSLYGRAVIGDKASEVWVFCASRPISLEHYERLIKNTNTGRHFSELS